MPEVKTVPTLLQPFVSFGCDVQWNDGDQQAKGTCPFCDREQKFFVNVETGQWDCKTCHEDGNVYTFLRKMHEKGTVSEGDLEELATDRGVLPSSLLAWGLKKSHLKDEWIVPGYDSARRTNNLYRRVWNNLESRWYLNGAKGLNHQMFGLAEFDPKKSDLYLCEGMWDGIALWEVLRYTKADETDSLSVTGNPSASVLATANVVAVPSCSVFSEYWTPLFAGKRVFIIYHNDWPDKNGRCAGPEGMKRTVQLLLNAADPPGEVHAINWSGTEEGFKTCKNDPSLKKGYDIRDAIGPFEPSDRSNRVRAVASILSRLEPVPPDWVEGAKGSKGKLSIEPLECDRWDIVLEACKKAIVLTEGHDRALCFIFACAGSVDVGGDQLWGKVISPPSGGKTTLVDGICLAKKYACLKSITTGIHSGWRDKGGDGAGETDDKSLMAEVKGKAMIVKDADTLLQADNLTKILSELRDAYDRNSSTHYRNAIKRDYENHSFVVLLMGTPAIRKLDSSELGQRMVDCVIMEKIDKDLENEINRRSIDSFRRLMMSQDTLNGDGVEGKEMSDAKRLIGGYLIYLRQNMKTLISGIRMSDDAAKRVTRYAELISYFRARPSNTRLASGRTVASMSEEATRELSTRLQRQLAKLAYCSAVVLGRETIDEEVLRRVKKSALDTARGKTLDIAGLLFAAGTDGVPLASLNIRTSIETRELKILLAFLKGIDATDSFVPEGKTGLGSSTVRWKLTDYVYKLYGDVFGSPVSAPAPSKTQKTISTKKSPSRTPKGKSSARIEKVSKTPKPAPKKRK